MTTGNRKAVTAKKTNAHVQRKAIPVTVQTAVLIEAGYRCAVPTCRNILAIDIHHICEVAAGGGNDPANLIALCPTCHALYHRHTISAEAIYTYKAMLVAIGRAFDRDAIDRLLFLQKLSRDFLIVTGDGLLHFDRLIAAGLAEVEQKGNNNWLVVTYAVNISERGRMLVSAWLAGDRTLVKQALSSPPKDAM